MTLGEAARAEQCFVRRGTGCSVTALLFAVFSVPGVSRGGQYNTQSCDKCVSSEPSTEHTHSEKLHLLCACWNGIQSAIPDTLVLSFFSF